MEVQRFVLIMALSVVGFLLWNAWQEDYGVKPKLVSTTEQQNSAQVAVNDDLPAVSLSGPAHQNQPLPKTPVNNYASSGFITVETDLLKIKIAQKGGDIVRVDLKDYPVSLETPDELEHLLNDEPSQLLVAQSGLISAIGPDTTSGERLNFLAKSQSYTLGDSETLSVPLYWRHSSGVEVEKIFTFKKDSYLVNVDYKVNNNSSDTYQAKFYTQLKRKYVEQSLGLGAYSFSGAALSSEEEPYEKLDYDDLLSDTISRDVQGGWAAMVNHYFIAAWIPASNYTSHYYSKVQRNNQNYILGMTSPKVEVAPNSQQTIGGQLYVGPKIQSRLEAAAPKLKLTVDYGWLWFLSQPLFWLLSWFHKLVGNWGWAIIFVTICVKAAFFQLSATSYRSMAKMRKIQPKMVALKERYGDDRQKFSQALMELYKTEKVNPMGGCLPILVQIPVFIALYWVLLESVELRQAPFILWIQDLSVKDPYFVLPVLMGITMFLQQLLNPAPVDPLHAKMMKLFPVIFTFFFIFFPSGLVLYWFVSNVLSIIQQWVITRVIMKADA